MNKFSGFIKTTLLGGILFLIPTMIFLYAVGRAIELLRQLAEPIEARLPYTHLAGIRVATILTVLLLFLVCFLAGLFMRTDLAKKIKTVLEERVLVYIPGYRYIQALATEKLTKDTDHNWKPAIVTIDDNEVICFVIDESENYCSIFLPAAPSPSSGSVCAREKGMVRYLPITVSEAIMMIRNFGKGAAAVIEPLQKPAKKQE